MDWNYLSSLSPEDLTDGEKDSLYNTVTWLNCDDESLDLKKCIVFIRITQEVLKYKGEQVEVLLHKLDELATQQGEEEGRKIESDTEIRSSRSRKSSSIEIENLEQKYIELKGKYKKQMRLNEKNANEMAKLQKTVSNLRQEKNRLINELQLATQDDTHSDVSERVKEQHKELVQTIHNKNKQISDLLRDIEATEEENTVLREKLTTARDELATATKELSSLTENFKSSKIDYNDFSEKIKKLTAENEHFQDEIQDILEQKGQFEHEMAEFTEEVNLRVDEWKKILEEKEREITDLKLRQVHPSHHSSLSSIPPEADQTQLTLNKLLLEREKQLLEVKTQLQHAVKEMEEATASIKQLKEETAVDKVKITDLTVSVKELKKQLKVAHERCQDLHNDLMEAEKLAADKDIDIQEILDKAKGKGSSDLSDVLKQIQDSKDQNRAQEKQIRSLVKASNKLQDLCDLYEKENKALREKLNITSDESVDVSNVSIKQKQHNRELQSLKKVVQQLEEDKLELKIQLRQQSRSGDDKPLDSYRSQDQDTSSKEQIEALVDENEALRKGLHEIMNALNTRKETSVKEVKSETLEQLLRALDVKHISGWYHPAMRLQAELHNQEGMNAELREQLRLARLESLSARTISEKSLDIVDSGLANALVISDLADIKDIHQTLQDLFAKLDEDALSTSEIETRLETYKDNFQQIRQQIGLLYQEYLTEKQKLVDRVSECEEKLSDLEETNEINERKLNLLIKETTGDEALVTKSLELAEANVVLCRKRSFLENEVKRLLMQETSLRNDLSGAESACLKKITELGQKNKTLKNNVDILSNKLKGVVDPNDYFDVKHTLESLTIKYRDLLRKIGKMEQDKDMELKLSEEIRKNLQNEKTELSSKITSLCEKLYNCKCIENTGSELAKKLALTEASELSERQRANHTNNLYELVKEQLQKSDERFKQIDKYNTEILQKNLVLQEQLKDAENKIVNFVDVSIYRDLQTKYDQLSHNTEQSESIISTLQEELFTLRNSTKAISCWNSEREQELLNLKHQIVDLQAVSDEKMQIARLSSELSHSRMQEADCSRKIEHLTEELSSLNTKCEELSREMHRKLLDAREKENELRKKVSVLQELLVKSKLQYLGSVPLPSEEKFVNNIQQAVNDKHEAFLNLYKTQITASESTALKEHYEKELLNIEKIAKNCGANFQDILTMLQERSQFQFNETKYRRRCALKETQLQHIFDRVKIQDQQIIKLEEELFALHKNFSFDLELDTSTSLPQPEHPIKSEPSKIKITKIKETQTDLVQESLPENEMSNNLQADLIKFTSEISAKEQTIQQLKSKITEHEMNISLFRKQLGDKQSQLTFYEKHILELQNKKDTSIASEPIDLNTNEEVLALKCSVKTFQDNLKQKEDEILKYQSLLKDDRDKHSMAASLMREELKVLEQCLAEEKQKVAELKSSIHGVHPSKAALEQYFLQVHSLEDELADLRTKVSSLESQLQASRQEAVRWRVLANDRLETMQKLGNDLEDLHRNEITAYKNEADKWREEVTNLKQMISKYRSEIGHDGDFHKLIKDKENKIHELGVMVRQAKAEARKNIDKFDADSLTKVNELESTKEQLLKEHEAIKRRFDQLLTRERSAREEIRELKGKLLKKPALSARSDKSDRSIKEQLQKKINLLENEIVELKENLARQVSINEAHRVKISQDFERWNKQKHYQQLSEKLKAKLKTKEADFEKLQSTCAGYRLLIERLEREKYNLELKIRNLKTGGAQQNTAEIEILKLENMKLMSENETLTSKLEMQQHHSGGLGAAMLQEKLEAQERKIAVLELSNKGTVEVRAELERLHNTVSNLQKSNLCREAENLDLKLDLERSSKEVPHLREQIQHLENYIEVLKKENVENSEVEATPKIDSKKISELERTIFVLKRVVEKLQAENKRLLTGKRFYPDHTGSADKLGRDHQRLKEQYCESVQKVTKLEEEIKAMKAVQAKPVSDSASVLSEELAQVREQLEQKTQLLNKVKVLLQRAAIKEKALLEELEDLKLQTQKTASSRRS